MGLNWIFHYQGTFSQREVMASMSGIFSGFQRRYFWTKRFPRPLNKMQLPLDNQKGQELICNFMAFVGDAIGNFRDTM